MKRRAFIKETLAAGTGIAMSSGIIAAEPFSSGKTATGRKVIVAGAGITGLCCAYELMKSGNEVVVLEASGRYGGHVFTGRDGLSDGLYADFGADHITKPGYEKFFDYIQEFGLTAIPYPFAEGSEAIYDKSARKMIGGKFYTSEMLRDPAVLRKLGFNDREVQVLSQNPMHELKSIFVNKYLNKFTDPYQPFGAGLDDYDKFSIADLFKKEGASATALRFLGGNTTSALYYLWRLSVMKSRGIPFSEGETFHLKDGNEQLPIAFAKRLGDRVRLNHPVLSIRHNAQGVTVGYKAFNTGKETEMTADALVVCISLPVFRKIPVSPALSPAKQYIVNSISYSSHPFYVFEASSKFWLEDGLESISMDFEHPYISSIWMETNEVDTHRVILKAYGPGGLSPQQVLAAFREVYPGKKDSIEQALTLDWTKDKYAPTCEMNPFLIGELHKFWPQIMLPEGRIYFAGTYADNMSRGMESCLRSAQRVAAEINKI